jgi:hypothetical protein
MKKLYTYKAQTFNGGAVETIIDLTKIVSIEKAGGGVSFHRVFCTGLRVPIELYDMPETEAKSAEEYEAGRAANYAALVAAWEAFGC